MSDEQKSFDPELVAAVKAALKAELKAEILHELRLELGLVSQKKHSERRPEEESAELLDRLIRREGVDSMDNLVEEHLINRSPR